MPSSLQVSDKVKAHGFSFSIVLQCIYNVQHVSFLDFEPPPLKLYQCLGFIRLVNICLFCDATTWFVEEHKTMKVPVVNFTSCKALVYQLRNNFTPL